MPSEADEDGWHHLNGKEGERMEGRCKYGEDLSTQPGKATSQSEQNFKSNVPELTTSVVIWSEGKTSDPQNNLQLKNGRNAHRSIYPRWYQINLYLWRCRWAFGFWGEGCWSIMESLTTRSDINNSFYFITLNINSLLKMDKLKHLTDTLTHHLGRAPSPHREQQEWRVPSVTWQGL